MSIFQHFLVVEAHLGTAGGGRDILGLSSSTAQLFSPTGGMCGRELEDLCHNPLELDIGKIQV